MCSAWPKGRARETATCIAAPETGDEEKADMSQNDSNDIPPDPIYAKSLSIPIFLACMAVVGAVVLAIADDMWLRRPYLSTQRDWQGKYTAYLEDIRDVRRSEVDDQLKQLDDYVELSEAVVVADEETKTALGAVQREIYNLDSKLKAVLKVITSPRSEIAALSYKAEHAAAIANVAVPAECDDAQPYLEEIAKIEAREARFEWMERAGDDIDPSVAQEDSEAVGALIAMMLDLQEAKATKQSELASAGKPLTDAIKARDGWLARNLGNLDLILENADDDAREEIASKVAEVGVSEYLDTATTRLTSEQIQGLLTAAEDWNVGDLTKTQIHIPETANWVDRCETCHMNARSPLPVTAADMGGEALFARHSRADEIFAKHDPKRFGCSMCHGGNGVAVISEEDAHGLNHHWLQRLHPAENFEAGCVQCHEKDAYLEGAERHNEAKSNFRHFGCWGCHKMKGYDEQPEMARAVAKQVGDIDVEIQRKQMRFANLKNALNTIEDDDEFAKVEPQKARDQAALTMEVAGLRTQREVLVAQLQSLYKEEKTVGPNLKDLRAKVRPEWLTQWIENPKHWRPTTKMPAFRWDEAKQGEDVKDVAAFLWQSATDVMSDVGTYGVSAAKTGDVTNGENLFKTVGCLSCHAKTEGETTLGNDFAANLSNLGDKYNRTLGLSYYVRWIMNPRHRIAPYCADCRRDLTPDDFVNDATNLAFSREHTTCPNCGHELKWDNPTVMPSFRLSRTQATDIASYLIEDKSDQEFESAPWLEEDERFQRGRRLVQHLGCAGCHEIGGLEEEQRIGTELTGWGSKPMERLDFGHYTHDAKAHDDTGGHDPLVDMPLYSDAHPDETIFKVAAGDYAGKWYNHRGFAAHKLAEPDLYDHAKNVDYASALRMPKFNLDGQQILDISTLLMGSVEAATMPQSIKYNPDETGQAVRDGWWIVKKYNCEGCHQILPDQVPFIQTLPGWEDKGENAKNRPPYLVGTGFRTRPDFLAHFLHDPSLGGSDPKAVRDHLSTRMPTFMFSESEIRTLVRFFDALSNQPPVYQPPQLEPLSDVERKAADRIWQKGPCLQCHVVGDLAPNDETKAPNLDYAKRRLRPEWMARWIQNPTELQPGTEMPALFKKECPNCLKLFDNAEMDKHAMDSKSGNRDECPNCAHDLGPGRWVFINLDFPEVNAIKSDHIELMIRYLNDGKFIQTR
jgi:cytochrome c2